MSQTNRLNLYQFLPDCRQSNMTEYSVCANNHRVRRETMKNADRLEQVADVDTTDAVEQTATTDTTATTAETTQQEQVEQEQELKYTDKQVNDIIAKRLAKEQDKWKSEYEKAKTEAEKLAQMNAQEKAKYEIEKREQELAQRESQIQQRELTAQAKDELTSKGLPIELADILDYTDAESVKESMTSVETVFQQAIEKQVNEKLRGRSVPKTAQSAESETAFAKINKKYKK